MGGTHDVAALEALIRSIPDFPEPGIVFRDITPLLAQPGGRLVGVGPLAQLSAVSLVEQAAQ